MMTQLHDFKKLIPRLTPSIWHFLEKIPLLLIPIPILMLFVGIEGIIKNDTPENLATFNSLGLSFFNLFGLHTLIIVGALGITLIIWFVTKNIWGNSRKKPNDDKHTMK